MFMPRLRLIRGATNPKLLLIRALSQLSVARRRAQYRRRTQLPDVGSGDLGARLTIFTVIHAAGADFVTLDEREPRTVGAASLPRQRFLVTTVHRGAAYCNTYTVFRLAG